MDVGNIVCGLALGNDFEMDALTRAVLGSINCIALMASRHHHAPLAGITEHNVTITDVTDTVVKHHEEIWAAIDAKACSSATVLIDPDLYHQHPRS